MRTVSVRHEADRDVHVLKEQRLLLRMLAALDHGGYQQTACIGALRGGDDDSLRSQFRHVHRAD